MIRFSLFSKNRNFFNFTELDHDLNYQRYYISNRKIYRTHSENSTFVLHQDQFLNQNQLVLIGSPSTDLQKLFGFGEIKIIGETDEKTLNDSSNSSKKMGEVLSGHFGQYQVFSIDYPDGVILLYVKELTPRAFLIADFFIDEDYLQKRPHEQQRVFNVKLKNRAVFWRYYFIEQSEKIPQSVEIFDGKTKLKIADIEEVKLINNKKAVVTTVSSQLPLFYQYEDRKLLATINENVSLSSPNIIKLPLPSPDRIKALGELGEKAYLVEMYVTYKLKS